MKKFSSIRLGVARFKASVERFRDEVKGVAAVEFALLAPILILLFFSTLEISFAMAVNRKVSRVSSAVADLITQSRVLTEQDVTDIFRISEGVMFPYKNQVDITLTGIKVTNNQPKIVWSRSNNGGGGVPGASYNLPQTIINEGDFYVAAVVQTHHKPYVGLFNFSGDAQGSTFTKDTSGWQIHDEIFLRPRSGTDICIKSPSNPC